MYMYITCTCNVHTCIYTNICYKIIHTYTSEPAEAKGKKREEDKESGRNTDLTSPLSTSREATKEDSHYHPHAQYPEPPAFPSILYKPRESYNIRIIQGEGCIFKITRNENRRHLLLILYKDIRSFTDVQGVAPTWYHHSNKI